MESKGLRVVTKKGESGAGFNVCVWLLYTSALVSGAHLREVLN